MTLSYSDLNTFLRCPKQFEYKTIRKIQRVRKDATLHQGTAIHALLMSGFLAMQRGDSVLPAVSEQWVELDEAVLDDFSAFPAEAEPVRDMLAESHSIVQRYFEQVDWTGWTVLHVEEEFTVTIDGTTLSFTPDLVMQDPNGNVWIVDHKSTATIDPSGVPFSSQQSLIYLAGVRSHYPNTAGFLFNNIRKKLPTEPRLNKTRHKDTGLYHVNDLNRIDTEYEMLLAFLREEAPELLDEPGHRQRLAELRDGPDRFFSTQRILANEAALSQIVEESSWTMKDIERAIETDRFPRVLQDDRGYLSCKKCEFQEICAAELLDLNTELVLRESYEPRDPKNPYETEDE
jgi:hypothetical protein